MKREIVKIDEELCNGCGLCIPKCHEGALQIIDEKAVLVSDLMCDGLGACVGHCPQGALTIEKREAEPYDEIAVTEEMVRKGNNVVAAHLKHLKDHNEHAFLRQGVLETQDACGCPGSREMSFQPERIEDKTDNPASGTDPPSALRHWPIQLHLINPAAGYFQGADLLVAADCAAFAVGNFHARYLRDKSLVIACPKLDGRQEVYREKITALIDRSLVNTITVMIMEVPCCGGLLDMVQSAAEQASRKVPIKIIRMGIRGQVLAEEWA